MMNKYQTVFTEEDFKLLPKEVKAEFYEFLETVPFIKWLIQPENVRGFAKNLTRWNNPNDLKNRKEDPNGKIYADITKPHILENMDYFRERAIFYDKYHKYTDITPNPNPKSDYAKFWRKELKRWKEGMIRESDGEWIPGGLYFYWNYCPIWLVEETKEGAVEGTRQRKFPKPWLGDYLFFHYMEQARNNGEHVKMLKTRGVGASFKMGSLSPRNMYIYPGSGNPNFHLASDKTFLTGDKGVFGKVIDTLDWIADNTPLPKLRLVNSIKSMEIQLGHQDEYGVRKGPLSSVYGISLKDNPDKARGIRGPLIHYEEDGLFPHLESAWNINRKAVEDGKVAFGQMVALGCVCAGTKIWTKDFKQINIEELKQADGIIGFDINTEKLNIEEITNINPPADKECVRISTSYRTLECSYDHPILVRTKQYKNTSEIIGKRKDYYAKLDKWYESNKYKTIAVYNKEWKEAVNLKVGDNILVADKIDVWGNATLFDARLVGMLIGDGSYGMRRHYDKIEFKTPSFSNCDAELVAYVLDNYKCNIEVQRLTKDGRLYHELSISNLIPKLKEIGIAGQSKTQKRLPTNYMNLTKEDSALLLAGLYDTDGYIRFTRSSGPCSIQITQSSEEILIQIKELLEKFGIVSIIRKSMPRLSPNRKDRNPWYTLIISTKESIRNFYKNIPLLIQYKKESLEKIYKMGLEKEVRVYNTFDNIREEKVIKIERIGIKPVFNLTTSSTHTYLSNNIITHNTGGVSGGDFAGAEKLFYNPTLYRIYGIPNVYDKNSTGKTLCGFFWGAYLNRKGCYDINSGEPDVTKALMEIVINRVKTRTSATDSKTITQNIAEEPITPQDAVMRVEGTVFPVADLKDYLEEISSNMLKFTSPHYVGNLIINSQGDVEFRNSSTVYPVRDFPALDNKKGAVEIFELPKKGKDSFRYILGCLPTGEKVLTNKGLTNVENVTLEHKLINKEGELVTIKNLQEYNVKDEDIYTFKVSNTFRKTTFTKEHPIYVSKNKFGYVSYNKTKRLGVTQKYHKFTFNFEKAEDVKVGDYIQVPNIYLKENNFNYCEYWDNIGYRTDKLINNPLNNEDFWWFIGLWLGDGWCESDGYNISVSFNKSEKFYIDKLKNLINNLFNRKYNERIRNNCVEIKFSFQQLNSFLTNTFGKYAYGKFIPEWVKYLPNNLKTSLILGYLNSDGSVTKNNIIEFVSINLELLESVQDILFSLGVISSLSKLRNASERIINNKISNTKEAYHLRISYHNSILLKEILKCKDAIKLKKLTITKDKLRRSPEGSCFFSNDKTYIYFKITEIEKSKYTGKVYNFECDTHTFMCHHITTHNCDPYDDDIVEYSDSLGSAIVFDRYTRRIVAEYTGRPGSANEFYEIVYRLARFYNATIMYENNKKGLFAYFNNVKGAITMLADTPEILTDKQLSKPKSISGNVSKGINATAAINSYGLRLQADWMLEAAYSEEVLEQDEEDSINKVIIPNFRKIRSVGYIKEAVAWHPKLNADRVSAMNMVMIYDTELSQYETFGTKSMASKSIDPFYSKIYPIGKDSGTITGKGNKLVFGYTPK